MTPIRYAVPVMLALGAAAMPAIAAPGSTWSMNYNMGTTEYATGEFQSRVGGGLSLSCPDESGKKAMIMAEIAGDHPAGTLTLVTASRAGAQTHRFAVDGEGMAWLPQNSAALKRLWAGLRSGETVTIRFPDERSSVQSLAGSGKVLPRTACG